MNQSESQEQNSKSGEATQILLSQEQQMSSEESPSIIEDNKIDIIKNDEAKSNENCKTEKYCSSSNAGTTTTITNDEPIRRVSFPAQDCDLVTGYLEPANPWASSKYFFYFIYIEKNL